MEELCLSVEEDLGEESEVVLSLGKGGITMDWQSLSRK